jgi:hypothetical protein
MSICILVTVALAGVTCLAGLAVSTKAGAAPAVQVPAQYAPLFTSFLQDAKYLCFQSGSVVDLALAQANVSNARDLLGWVAALEAFAEPVVTDGAAVALFRTVLRTDLAELEDEFRQLATARLSIEESLLNGSDPGLFASASLIPAPPGAASIEAAASRGLSNFKKSWSLKVNLSFGGLYFPNQLFESLAPPAAGTAGR